MLAVPVTLAAALLAPLAVAQASETGPPARFSAQLGLGPADVGAPQVLLGAGWAPLETGTLRVDLFLRMGFSEAAKVHFEEPSGMAGDASLQAVSGYLDLAVTRRLGRFEPFAGGGFSVAGAGGTLVTWCRVELAPACAATSPPPPRTESKVDGTSIWGPVAFGGLRFALTEQFLLEAEVRYQREGRSRLREAPISAAVGGTSGLLSVTWRFGTGTPTPPIAGVLAPAPAPPTSCAAVEVPSIPLHLAQGFLCFPDPVRGGHYCEARTTLGQFVELDACEAACRGESASCPATGNSGAACSRCVKDCARTTFVACPAAEAGWSDGRPVCLLPAGRYGLESERAVPATCTPRP